MTGIFTSVKISGMWNMETPITHTFQRASTSPRPQCAASSTLYEVFQCKAYRKNFSIEIQLLMRRPHHIKCTWSGSFTLHSARSRRNDFTIWAISINPGSKPILSWRIKRGFWSEEYSSLMTTFPTRSSAISMAVYCPFSCGLSALKIRIYCTSSLKLKMILKT